MKTILIFSKCHISLFYHDIATIFCKSDKLVESSNVGILDVEVENEECVVDSCQKYFDFVYHP